MKKDYNLYELAELIKAMCKSHPIVNDFIYKETMVDTIDDLSYPLIAMTFNNVVINTNTIDYNINLLYADRLKDNRDNEVYIQSAGITSLLDLLNAINEYTNIAIDDTYQFTPFAEQFADNAAGIYTTLTFKSPNYIGDCTWFEPRCVKC